jgi:nitrilase
MPDRNDARSSDMLSVGVAQIAPVWLFREETLEKVENYVNQAVENRCQLVIFSEAQVPGYPWWLERTNGAKFNSPIQKEIHAHYMDQAVQIEAGHLDSLCNAARKGKIAIILGIIERPPDRGGHSLYCTFVYIDNLGVIQTVHRKLQPTYEERLVWSPGDGHGFRVNKLGAFTIGGLNCWENWMPLSRTTLYALGEDLHVAIWPGSCEMTEDITRFIALEGRSYVISAGAVLRKSDISLEIPHAELILENSDEFLSDGGSCIAAPDGEWVVEPLAGEEKLIVAELDHKRVREERQNFDPVGHYSRPDVTRLVVNRERQSILSVQDGVNED